MTQANRSMLNMLLLGVAVVALVVLVYFLAVQSQTDDSSQTQSASVNNAEPTITGTYIAEFDSPGTPVDEIFPVESTATKLVIKGVGHDLNGCSEINDTSKWAGKVYMSSATDAHLCNSSDSNDCFELTSGMLALDGCSGAAVDTDVNFTYSIDLPYYAVPTLGGTYQPDNWIARIELKDFPESTAAVGTDTTEIATLSGFDITSTVNYGAVAYGSDSGQRTVTVTPTGNVGHDIIFTPIGAGMVCDYNGEDGGTIPWSQVKVDLTPATSWAASAYTLTVDESDVAVNLNLPAKVSTASVSRNAEFILALPASGLNVAGVCSGSLTATSAAYDFVN